MGTFSTAQSTEDSDEEENDEKGRGEECGELSGFVYSRECLAARGGN